MSGHEPELPSNTFLILMIREPCGWIRSNSFKPYELFPAVRRTRKAGNEAWLRGEVKFDSSSECTSSEVVHAIRPLG